MIETFDSKDVVGSGERIKSFVAKNTKKDLINKLYDKYKKLDCYIGKGEFSCNQCDKRLLRYSIWDKTIYPSGKDYALFKCFECKEIYIGEMDRETKDWAIDHIKTVDNLVDIVI